MADPIVNTSPLCYLHRAGILHVMPAIFSQVLVPGQVVAELSTGRAEGYDLPDPILLPGQTYERFRLGRPSWSPSAASGQVNARC